MTLTCNDNFMNRSTCVRNKTPQPHLLSLNFYSDFSSGIAENWLRELGDDWFRFDDIQGGLSESRSYEYGAGLPDLQSDRFHDVSM